MNHAGPNESSRCSAQAHCLAADGPTGPHETDPDASDRVFLAPAEFARRTGLSLATVRRYIAAGRIPVAQPGGFRSRLLIPHDAISLPLPALEGHRALTTEPVRRRSAVQNPANNADRLSGPRPGWLTKSKHVTT
jgi:excisionase family DNA binding protein